MPQVLLMENVPEVIGTNNIKSFASWLAKLETLGYKCYWKVLNAKDYGIPQNRERCFMVSVLGDYYYQFPQPIKLDKKLKDLLEENVDEKFYLSDKMKTYIASENEKYTGNNKKSIINRDVAVTVTTRTGNTRADASDYVCDELPINYNIKSLNETLKQNGDKLNDGNYIDCYNKKIRDDNLAGTITTRVSASNNSFVIEIDKDKFEQGGVCGKDTRTKREQEQRIWSENGYSPTITTSNTDILKIAVKQEKNLKQKLCNDLILNGKVKDGDVIRHSYSNSRMKKFYPSNQENHDCSPTLDTRCDCLGVCVNYRIRKLTPKECMRLMGLKDQEIDKISRNQSNASLYHLAGDSIVVDVLMAIFKEML